MEKQMSNIPTEVGALDVPGFCRWAGVSHATFYREVKAGRIAIRKVGRKSVVLMDDARAWLNALPEASKMEAA